MWPSTLSGRLPIVALVRRYHTNQLMGRGLIHRRPKPFLPGPCGPKSLSGISTPFEVLSLTDGQITHVLLTRPPLDPEVAPRASLDLHVLSTPPAFVLSQDQTLR